jgi:hypothetical protein
MRNNRIEEACCSNQSCANYWFLESKLPCGTLKIFFQQYRSKAEMLTASTCCLLYPGFCCKTLFRLAAGLVRERLSVLPLTGNIKTGRLGGVDIDSQIDSGRTRGHGSAVMTPTARLYKWLRHDQTIPFKIMTPLAAWLRQ